MVDRPDNQPNDPGSPWRNPAGNRPIPGDENSGAAGIGAEATDSDPFSRWPFAAEPSRQPGPQQAPDAGSHQLGGGYGVGAAGPSNQSPGQPSGYAPYGQQLSRPSNPSPSNPGPSNQGPYNQSAHPDPNRRYYRGHPGGPGGGPLPSYSHSQTTTAPPRLDASRIVGAVAIGVVLAIGVWLLAKGGPAPAPSPEPTPVTSPSTATSTTEEPAIPYQRSTRSPSWEPTRTTPREGMAPTVAMGVPAEYVDDESVGLITVLAAEWSSGTQYRPPDPGFEFLAVQLEFEGVLGAPQYSPVRAYIADADGARYEFQFNSSLTDNPQFEIGDLPAGQTMTGWVIFQVPRQDVTFIYTTFDEESVRVPISGGPQVAPSSPDTSLSTEVDVDSCSGKGRLAFEGYSWVDANTLAVKVRVRTTDGYCWTPLNDFGVETADGQAVELDYGSTESSRPILSGSRVRAGDELSGWLHFAVPRGDVTLTFTRGVEPIAVPISG